MRSVARNLAPRLPLPVAWALTRLARSYEQSDALTRWKMVVDLFELSARTLASLSLGLYSKSGAADTSVNKELVERLCKRMSLGDWWALTLVALRAVRKGSKSTWATLVGSALLTSKGQPSPVARSCEAIVTDRNRHLGHGYVATTSEYGDLVAKHFPTVQTLLELLSSEPGGRLLAVAKMDGRSTITQVLPLMGPQVAMIEEESSLRVEDGSVLVGDIVFQWAAEPVWPVFPLQFFEENVLDDHADVFLLDGLRNATEGIDRVWYIGVPSRAERRFNRGQDLADRVSRHLSRLFGQAGSELARTAAVQLVGSDADYTLPGQTELIQRHHSRFVGRQELINLIERAHGSAVLLESAPGAGKTGIAAEVAHRTNAVHHFFDRASGRSNISAAARSIASQLARRLDRPLPRLEDDSSTLRILHRLVFDSSRSGSGQQLFIVVDALDEADVASGELGLSFLPDPLPATVSVLATSRPGDHLALWKARADVRSLPLEPLSRSEVESIVRRRIPQTTAIELTRYYGISKGNPLLLQLALEAQINPAVRSTPLDDSINNFYDILMADAGQEIPLVRRLLAILGSAERSLTLNEIGEVLDVERSELRSALKRCRMVLSFEAGHFQVFHQTFREYLRSDALNALSRREIRTANEELRKACLGGMLLAGQYRRDHLPSHLVALGDWEALLALAGLPDYADGVAVALARELLRGDRSTNQTGRAHALLASLTNESSEQLLTVFCATVRRLYAAGHYGDFADLAASALTRAPRPVVGDLHAIVAQADRDRGRLQQATDRIRPLFEEDASACWRPFAIRYLELTLAEGLREMGDYDGAQSAYSRALRRVDPADDPDAWLEIYHHLCDIDFVRGQLDCALAGLKESVLRAENDRLHLRWGQALRIRGHVEYVRGDSVASIASYEAAREHFALLDDRIHLAKIANNLAEARLLAVANEFKGEVCTGAELDELLDLLGEAEELNRALQQQLELGKTRLTRAMVCRVLGDEARARESLELARHDLHAVGYGTGMALLDLENARLLNSPWRRPSDDDRHAAVVAAKRCYNRLKQYGSYPVYRALAVYVAARAGADRSEMAGLLGEIPHLDQIPRTAELLASALN